MTPEPDPEKHHVGASVFTAAMARVKRLAARHPVGTECLVVSLLASCVALILLRNILFPAGIVAFAQDWYVPLLKDDLSFWGNDYAQGWSPLGLGTFITYNTDLPFRALLWVLSLFLGLSGGGVTKLVVFLTFVGVAVGTWWLVRRLGLGRWPALTAGLVMASSGLLFNVFAYGYLSLMASLVALPVFVCLLRDVPSKRMSASRLLALCAAAFALMIHAQFAVLAVLAAVAVLTARLLTVPASGRATPLRILGRLVAPVGAVLVGYAALWVPNLLLSDRLGAIIDERSGAYFQGTTQSIIGSLQGQWVTQDFYWSRLSSIGVATIWGVVLVAAIATPFLRLRRGARDRFAISLELSPRIGRPYLEPTLLGFFLVVAGLAVTAADAFPFSMLRPLWPDAMDVLFRNVSYALALSGLGVAILLGALMDRIMSRWPISGWRSPALLLPFAFVLLPFLPWLQGGDLGGAVHVVTPPSPQYERLKALGLREEGRVLAFPLPQGQGLRGVGAPFGLDVTKYPPEVPHYADESPRGMQLPELMTSAHEDPERFLSRLQALGVANVIIDPNLESHWSDFIWVCQRGVLDNRLARESTREFGAGIPGLQLRERIGPIGVFRVQGAGRALARVSEGEPVWEGAFQTGDGSLPVGTPTRTGASVETGPILVGASPGQRLLDFVPARTFIVNGRIGMNPADPCETWTSNIPGLAFWWDEAKLGSQVVNTTFTNGIQALEFQAPAPGRYHLLAEVLQSPRSPALAATLDPRGPTARTRVWQNTGSSASAMRLREWSFRVEKPGPHAIHLQPKRGQTTGDWPTETATGRIAVVSDREYRAARSRLNGRIKKGFTQVVRPDPFGRAHFWVPATGRYDIASSSSPSLRIDGAEVGARAKAIELRGGRHLIETMGDQIPVSARRSFRPDRRKTLIVDVTDLEPGLPVEVRARVCTSQAVKGTEVRLQAADGFPIARRQVSPSSCASGGTVVSFGVIRPRYDALRVTAPGSTLLSADVGRVRGDPATWVRVTPSATKMPRPLAVDGAAGPTEDAVFQGFRLRRPASGTLSVVLPVTYDDRWGVTLRDSAGRPVAPVASSRFLADGYANGWILRLPDGATVTDLTFNVQDGPLMGALVSLERWWLIVLAALSLVTFVVQRWRRSG